jgi:hypothetical protein
MAKDKKPVLIYVDWISIFEELSDEEAGKLVKHLFRYVNDRNPEAPDRLTKLLFEPIKQTLKRDLVKYEDKRKKNRDNALMRWNKTDAIACDGIKSDAKHADSDSDSVIDSDKDKEIKEVVSFFNETSFSKISKLTDSRKKHLRSRLKEYGYANLIDMIQRADKSDFLHGKNDRQWKADFDWLMNPNNYVKVIEGKFDNKKTRLA